MTVDAVNRIDKTIDLEAPVDRVWRALTNRDELATWFQVTIEGDLVPGAQVWMTSVHAQHTGQRFLVHVIEMTPPRRIVWQWHPGEIDPGIDYSREPWTTVTFTLEPRDRGTRLRVAETGFDQIALARRAKVYRDNTEGWSEVVTWLKHYVEASR